MAVKSVTAQPLTPLVALLIFLSFIVLPLTTSAMLQTRVVNVAAGGDVQAVVNQCLTEAAGCRIVLQANADYTAPSGGLTLPNKSGDAYISIESSRYSEIPVRAFKSLRPTATEAAMMARIRSSHPAEPTIKTAPGAHHYKLLGLDIAPKPGGQAGAALKLGDSGAAQDTLAEVPHSLFVDKSWIRAGADQHIQRCVILNSANTDITNSWISDCHGVGLDTQAILFWNGPGPYRIINNLIEGAGENMLFGGADPSIPGLIPSNAEIRGNYFYKPLSWNFWNQANFQPIGGQSVVWTTSTVVCAGEDPMYGTRPRYVDTVTKCTARHWTVKNSFETKNARRLIVEGNDFENNWTDGQSGNSIVIKCNNQDETAPWSVTEDLLFQYNRVKGEAGINLLMVEVPPKVSAIGKRNYFRHNFLDVERLPFQGPVSGEDIQFEHNTWTSNIGPVFMLVAPEKDRLGQFIAPLTKGLVFNNNLGRRAEYGIKGDSRITGAEGKAALDAYFPGTWDMRGNVISGAPASQYPTGNSYPATWGEVQADASYRLLPTSPFKGKATDGKDPGVDWVAFDAVMAGSVTPLPSPSPVASPTVTPTPVPSTLTPSPDGTKATRIVDNDLNVWTLGPRTETLRNGVHVGGGFGTPYKFLGGVVYVGGGQPTDWFKWAGTGWIRVGLEPMPQPSPSPTPVSTPTPTPTPTPELRYEFRKYRWPTGTTLEDEALQDIVEKQAAAEGWLMPNCQVVGNWLRCVRLRQP